MGVLMLEGINDLSLVNKVVAGVPPLEDFANAYTGIEKQVRDAGAELFVSPLTPAGDLFRPSNHSATPEHQRRHRG